MKLFPRLKASAASLLVAALLASAAPARQTRTRPPASPARTGAARAKPDAQPRRETQEAQQQRAKADAKQRAEVADAADVTLDELFGADSYAIYGELRTVGQHFGSEEFRQMLEPLKLASVAPPEIVELYDFIVAHAEELAGARVAFGGMPVRPGLPSVVTAVEMPSAEEARKFAPRLRGFLAKSNAWGGANEAAVIETAATDGAAEAGGGNARAQARLRATPAAGREAAPSRRRAGAKEKEAASPFHIKQAGAVVALADSPFTFKKLRGSAEAPALTREPGFAAARARLATETLFLYFNTARINASTRRRAEEMEREHRRMAEEEEAQRAREAGRNANASAEAAKATGQSPTGKIAVTNVDPATGSVSFKGELATGPDGKITPEAEEEFKAAMAAHEAEMAAQEEALKKQSPEEQARRREREQRRVFERQLAELVFSGGPQDGSAWPESIGVGASFEGDSVVVRAFLVADSEDRPPRPIPLVPLLLAGPQVANEAANVLPADTDILVSASLDLPQMYDYVASMFKLFELAAGAAGDADKQGLFDSQVAAYEKQLKFKIKEDLINALGNEIAVAIPAETFGMRRASAAGRARGEAEKSEDGATAADVVRPSSPVVVISLRDKRAVQSLLPRALEALGVPGLSAEQLLQKQGEAELFTFSDGAVAFIDNFLVIAFDARSMKRVVEAYNEGRTLGRSRHYRDPADWQPRQVIGQGYVSSALLREALGDAHKLIDDIDDEKLRAYLAGLDPEPGAITLAATRDADGLMHELHVPKNVLALWTASTLVNEKLQAMRWNEAHAIFMMRQIARIQDEFKQSKGRYATMEELTAEESYKDGFAAMGDMKGYEVKMSALGDKFEATATPTGYPKLGRRSFYVDQTGLLRGGDLGGRPASSSTDPVEF